MQGKMKRQRTTASLGHERNFYTHGCQHIFGIDEAGRGPWAGPVSAGVVGLPLDRRDLPVVLKGVRDSKQMSARQREALVETIKTTALAWGVGYASAQQIDDLGIIPAIKLAMQMALDQAQQNSGIQPDCLFLDYMLWPERRDIPQICIVGGDRYSLSIAAASILAKVWRDAYMAEIAAQYPEYGFPEHKGYGTPQHQAALKAHGPSPIHRKSYAPVRAFIQGDGA